MPVPSNSPYRFDGGERDEAIDRVRRTTNWVLASAVLGTGVLVGVAAHEFPAKSTTPAATGTTGTSGDGTGGTGATTPTTGAPTTGTSGAGTTGAVTAGATTTGTATSGFSTSGATVGSPSVSQGTQAPQAATGQS